MAGTIYIVGTPIGNLQDFSPRAIETLKNCDFIAAEDTRVTLKLLNHFEIKKPLTSYFEHNKKFKGDVILKRILDGESCALVTDAGMPAISDPGMELINKCHEYGIKVVSIPGPTAFATALSVSGMDSSRFTFEGFLPVTKKARKEHLESIKQETRTMVFYEAPHKLSNTLRDLFSHLGNRDICIVRELTKMYEETIHTTLEQATIDYPENNLKGEIVLIVAGAKEVQAQITLNEAIDLANDYIEKGMSKNDAAKTVAKQTSLKKGDIYKALL
ncbi:MAG: 16S rRNA (cytidine(1402)-2'-O)-methyltransferase [Ruminococcaceae bacterium]|nr:16S rRNA (cytidine(1402)-2'-O)-methyltransferase [Oscillospiraceae bacterium]